MTKGSDKKYPRLYWTNVTTYKELAPKVGLPNPDTPIMRKSRKFVPIRSEVHVRKQSSKH